MALCPATYLRLEFSGGTEFKEELHDVIVTLLGGEEQGSRACLQRMIKIDTAAFTWKAITFGVSVYVFKMKNRIEINIR